MELERERGMEAARTEMVGMDAWLLHGDVNLRDLVPNVRAEVEAAMDEDDDGGGSFFSVEETRDRAELPFGWAWTPPSTGMPVLGRRLGAEAAARKLATGQAYHFKFLGLRRPRSGEGTADGAPGSVELASTPT